MVDLSFTDLAARFPTGSFTETTDDVQISLKTLLSETAIQLSSSKVTEFVAKLFHAAHAAQVAYNQNPANTKDITSYSAPFIGTTQTIDGQLFIPVSCGLNYLAPLGIDSAVPTTSPRQ